LSVHQNNVLYIESRHFDWGRSSSIYLETVTDPLSNIGTGLDPGLRVLFIPPLAHAIWIGDKTRPTLPSLVLCICSWSLVSCRHSPDELGRLGVWAPHAKLISAKGRWERRQGRTILGRVHEGHDMIRTIFKRKSRMLLISFRLTVEDM